MFHAAAAPAQINQQYVQQKMGEGTYVARRRRKHGCITLLFINIKSVGVDGQRPPPIKRASFFFYSQRETLCAPLTGILMDKQFNAFYVCVLFLFLRDEGDK